MLICLHGKVRVNLEALDKKQFEIVLDQPDKALVLPPLIWSSVTFGKGAVLLVLADQAYDEHDYIRERAQFEAMQEVFSRNIKPQDG